MKPCSHSQIVQPAKIYRPASVVVKRACSPFRPRVAVAIPLWDPCGTLVGPLWDPCGTLVGCTNDVGVLFDQRQGVVENGARGSWWPLPDGSKREPRDLSGAENSGAENNSASASERSSAASPSRAPVAPRLFGCSAVRLFGCSAEVGSTQSVLPKHLCCPSNRRHHASRQRGTLLLRYERPTPSFFRSHAPSLYRLGRPTILYYAILWGNVEVAEFVCKSPERYVELYGRGHHSQVKDPPWRAVPMLRLKEKLALAPEYSERIVCWGYQHYCRSGLGDDAVN